MNLTKKRVRIVYKNDFERIVEESNVRNYIKLP